MYNRLHKFIEDNNLIYNLQFGFRQKRSTSLLIQHSNNTPGRENLIMQVMIVEY